MKTFSALLAICAGNPPVPDDFPAQRPVTRSFNVFFICVWINAWVNNRKAGDLRRYRAHYDVTVMWPDYMIYLLILFRVTSLAWGINMFRPVPVRKPWKIDKWQRVAWQHNTNKILTVTVGIIWGILYTGIYGITGGHPESASEQYTGFSSNCIGKSIICACRDCSNYIWGFVITKVSEEAATSLFIGRCIH